MRYTGSLQVIQGLDYSLKGMVASRPPRAEVAHDGEAVQNAVWGYEDTKPLVYTRKYTLFLATGPRDLVPKASITLRFDLRNNRGHLCCSRHDLPVLKAHLTKHLPSFPYTLELLSEIHMVDGNGGMHFENHRRKVHV